MFNNLTIEVINFCKPFIFLPDIADILFIYLPANGF